MQLASDTVHASGGSGNVACCDGNELLAATPYSAVRYHFGMLLGVDDFETDQAYHRGKMRLHNAWLHGEGVVWGFGVHFNDAGELQVDPGLALDAVGHELHLDGPVCLDVGKWYAAHEDDPGLQVVVREDKTRRFSAHVVVRFCTCLSRQVPAIADPCSGARTDTAYSRVNEIVEILLLPNPWEPKIRPYHRLRVLFRLEDPVMPADEEVLERRDAIEAMPAVDQPKAYLEAFRELAALDECDRRPPGASDDSPATIFPEHEPTSVLLADIVDITVEEGSGGWAMVGPAPEPNVRVRPSHVATSTIQELLCGPLFTLGKPSSDTGDDSTTEPGSEPDDTEPGSDGDGSTTEPGSDAGDDSTTEPGSGTGDDSTTEPGSGAGDDSTTEPGTGGRPEPPLPPPRDAGPRISGVTIDARRITLQSDGALHRASVQVGAFSVSAFHSARGWTVLPIQSVRLDRQGTSLTLLLREDSPEGASLLRVIADGSGPAPLLGADLRPLAGGTGDPPSSGDGGRNFVHMHRLGESR